MYDRKVIGSRFETWSFKLDKGLIAPVSLKFYYNEPRFRCLESSAAGLYKRSRRFIRC